MRPPVNLGQVFTQILWTNRSPGPGVVPWCKSSRDVDPSEALMNTTRHMLLTAALAGSLTLAACSDEAQDPPSPSSSGPAEESSPAGETSPSGSPSSEPTSTEPSEDPSSSASPSDAGTSPSPSSPAPSSSSSAAPSPSDGGSPSPSDGASSPSEGAAGLPPMPAAARENSEEGAEAFARWYVETLNHLYQHPQTGILDKYAGKDCQRCERFAQVVREFSANDERAESAPFKDVGANSLATEGDEYIARVALEQQPTRVVSADGSVGYQFEADDDQGLLFELTFSGDGWIIDDLLSNPGARAIVEADK